MSEFEKCELSFEFEFFDDCVKFFIFDMGLGID